VRPGPAALLLFAFAAAALLARHTLSVAVLTAVLLAICLRAPARRRWLYLSGALVSAATLFVVTPLVERLAGPVLWSGPTVPVLGTLDVTTTELSGALFNALRLAAVGLAFAAYALLLDHDRLVQSAGRVIRSEHDVGIIALLCKRFTQEMYTRYFPTDWYDETPRELVSKKAASEIRLFFEAKATPQLRLV
jgi:hypothetical protein